MDQDRGAPAPPVKADKPEREARLAKALRDNLRRRKASSGADPGHRSRDG